MVRSFKDKETREAMVQTGRKLLPEYEKRAQDLSVHPMLLKGIMSLCESEKFGKGDKFPEPMRLVMGDPWDKVTRKLGYNFPHKGMSTYFMLYVLVIATLKHIEATEFDLQSIRMEQEIAEGIIDELGGIGEASFLAGVYSLMGPDFSSDAVNLRGVVTGYRTAKTAIAVGEMAIEAAKEVLVVQLGYLHFLEEHDLNGLIRKASNVADPKDLARVREIATKFMEGTRDNHVVMDLLSMKK